MKRPNISTKALAVLKSVTGKRARIVIDHIIAHGSITTDELKAAYGYDHGPRAARDVIDQGIPLKKEMIRAEDGRRMAKYSFGDLSSIRPGLLGGRIGFARKFKQLLIATQGLSCAICNAKFEARCLQIDHRIPYAVAGDNPTKSPDPADYMLVCGSCNRAKSWSCEHCKNWILTKNARACATCYWASPLRYTHIALREIRRLALVWTEAEVEEFDAANELARQVGQQMPAYVKIAIRRAVEGR